MALDGPYPVGIPVKLVILVQSPPQIFFKVVVSNLHRLILLWTEGEDWFT